MYTVFTPIKTLIVNYFDQYRHNSELLLLNITNDLKSMTSMTGKDAELLAEKIISTYVKPDDKPTGLNCSSRNTSSVLAGMLWCWSRRH